MEQRDLLKDQIDQMGKVLATILADFLGFNSNVLTSQDVEISNKQVQDKLDIDMARVKSIGYQELKDYLNTLKLTAEHIEMLSDYLFEISKIERLSNKVKANLVKVIDLLDIADEVSKTFSFNRLNKKQVIKDMQHSL